MELKDSPRLIVDQRREIFPRSHKTFKGTSENSKIRSCDKGVWDDGIVLLVILTVSVYYWFILLS